MKRAIGYLYYVVLIAAIPLASLFIAYLQGEIDLTFDPFPYAYLYYAVLIVFGVYLFLGHLLKFSPVESLICKAVTLAAMVLFTIPSVILPLGILNVVITGDLSVLPFVMIGYLVPSMIWDIVKMVRKGRHIPAHFAK